MSTSPSIIAGRYELLQKIGIGGTADVYRVFDRKLRTHRAMKILTISPRHRVLLRRRLEREAQSMAALDSPFLIRVYDVGQANEEDYVVMDLVEGGTLTDRLEADGPLPAATAVDFMLHVLAGLDVAHQAGVIHRDVKPQNVLLNPDNTARLADFGLALFDREDIERHTQVGVMMGSIAYMAPEQRQDASSVTFHADIYAAACTLYNLLTNASPIDLFMATSSSPRWSSIPPALKDIIRKATRAEPSARYASVQDLAHALIATRESLPVQPGPNDPSLWSTQTAIQSLTASTAAALPEPIQPPSPQPPAPPSADRPATVIAEIAALPSPPPANQTLAPATLMVEPPTQRRPTLQAGAAIAAIAAIAIPIVAYSVLFQPPAEPPPLAAHQPVYVPNVAGIPGVNAAIVISARASALELQARPPQPAPRVAAARPAQATSCVPFPTPGGDSPASGSWLALTTDVGSDDIFSITLRIGGPEGALGGCAMFEAGDGSFRRAWPLRGAMRDADTLMLDDGRREYVLTISGSTLVGQLRGAGEVRSVRFQRS